MIREREIRRIIIRKEAIHKERTHSKDLSIYGSYVIEISYCYLYKLYIIVFIISMHGVHYKAISC